MDTLKVIEFIRKTSGRMSKSDYIDFCEEIIEELHMEISMEKSLMTEEEEE